MGCVQTRQAKEEAAMKEAAKKQVEVETVPSAHILSKMSERNAKTFEDTYEMKSDLGAGNYSVVKLAISKDDNKEVAVKCTKRSTLTKEDEDSYLREVKILQSMDHPNIVKMFGFYAERTHYYLVMEVLKGGELFDKIVEKQYYNEKEARDVLKILLDAIHYCHERNIVHRDLKPENLLLVNKDDHSQIKVCDFGFARKVDKEKLATQCGTPGYVAPEILKGESYGLEVDMWSIGVIMYILLGGYPPFHDENRTLLFKKIKRGVVMFHSQYWDHISNDAKDLIKRMLTLDVTKRITAHGALEHAWMKQVDSELASHNLAVNLDELKVTNAKRKLKCAVRSIIMTNRLQQLVKDKE